MPIAVWELREQLLHNNPEFQKLAEQHNLYEAQLDRLAKDPYLSGETIRELTDLKKLKLRVKDEMERIVAQYAREVKQS